MQACLKRQVKFVSHAILSNYSFIPEGQPAYASPVNIF